MKVLGLLDLSGHASLARALADHGVALLTASLRPDAVLAELGSSTDEDARRAATDANVPVVWIVQPDEIAREDSRLPANAHFVVRPIQPDELVARLRRAIELDTVTTLELDDRRVELESGQVTAGDQVTSLTATEVRLLRVLVSAESRVLSRPELLRRVWGYRGGTHTRALDVAVRRLRTKIEPEPSSPRYLRTVVGVGYQLALTENHTGRGGQLTASGSDIRPDEVPVSDTPFWGRDVEQAALHRLLTHPGACVSLIGPPGMGKKRLALEALAQRGGLVWRVLVPQDPEALPESLLRVAGLGARSTLADALYRLAQSPETVLWLVGMQASQAGCAALIHKLRVQAPQARVLFTGTSPLGVPRERLLPLGPLTLNNSRGMLASLWERHAPFAEPLSPDDSGVKKLHEIAGGVPLVLELLGSGFATRSPTELARKWTSTSEHLQIQDVLSPMWSGLRTQVQLGMMGLCQLTGSVSPEGVEHILGTLLGTESAGVVRELLSHALVQRQQTLHGTRLWIPEPLVQFVREVDAPGPQAAARAAVFDWCRHLGETETLERLRTPSGAELLLELGTREFDLVRAIESRLLDGSQTLSALRGLYRLTVYYAGKSQLSPLLDQLDPTLVFEPVESAELAYLKLEASHAQGLPSPPPDRLDSALEAARTAGHADLESDLRISAGYLALGAANPELASLHAEAALGLVDQIKPWSRVNVLGFAVGPRVTTSERPDVQQALLRSFQERRAAGDHLTVARNSSWVAQPHWRAGRLDEALDALIAGVDAARALTDKVAEARDLGNVATVRFLLDDIPGAMEAQERALATMRRLEMRQGLSTDLSIYAELLHVVGESERSRQHTREALAAARSEMLPRYRWIAWRSSVKLHLANGEWEAAQAACSEGIAACGAPDGSMALELHLMAALALAATGHPLEGGPWLETAEPLYRALSDVNARLRLSGMLARLETLANRKDWGWTERYSQARGALLRTRRRDLVALDRLLASPIASASIDLL